MALEKWVDLTNQPLKRFAQDFSQWPALADFANRVDPHWGETHFRQNLTNYEAHAVWVFNASDALVYATEANPGPPLAPPAGVLDWARRKESLPGESFFAESRDGLLEVWCVPIQPENREAVLQGHLVVARLWHAGYLAQLAQLTDANLVLAPINAPPLLHSTFEQLDLALRGADGKPVRVLQARYPDPDFSATLAQDTTAVRLLVGFGLLVVVALWLAVRRWILRPLDCIGESLARDNPACIQPVLKEKNELGRIAQLVESSFLQKSALGREIEERKRTEAALRESESQVRQSLEVRARLARDLHDGVIQSIYAAGLGLESAITQLESDRAGARVRLQLCRQSLNEVIREVRGFISGIEPETMHQRGFAGELAALARTMQALWPVLITVQVNPSVAPRLNPTQELHALQISRECISNAVRHGGATEIDIHLGEEAGTGFLTVRDNGRGFDLHANQGAGSGLHNLDSRAGEMGGRVTVDSQIGRGTLITVTFSLAPPSA
jgi:signal transduction histidine kinase